MKKMLVVLAVVSLTLGSNAWVKAAETESLNVSKFVNVQIPEQKQKYGEVSAASKLYNQGHDLLTEGKLWDAIELFRKVTNEYPNHHIADDAAFWIGRASEEHKNLDTARAAYKDFLEKHPDSEYKADALFNLANVTSMIGDNQHLEAEQVEAAVLYRHFILEHQGDKRVPDAYFRQGLCLHRFGNINMAKLVWQELVQLFPNSTAAMKATEWLNDTW